MSEKPSKASDSLRDIVRSSARSKATALVSYDLEIPKDSIKAAIADGELGIDEIVGWFRSSLVEELAS